MMKLSKTLAIAAIAVSLAPSVLAYGQVTVVEPEVVKVNVVNKSQDAAQDGQCRIGVDPILVTALGLDKASPAGTNLNVIIACHAE